MDKLWAVANAEGEVLRDSDGDTICTQSKFDSENDVQFIEDATQVIEVVVVPKDEWDGHQLACDLLKGGHDRMREENENYRRDSNTAFEALDPVTPCRCSLPARAHQFRKELEALRAEVERLTGERDAAQLAFKDSSNHYAWEKARSDLVDQTIALRNNIDAILDRMESAETALGKIQLTAQNIVGSDSPIWDHYDPCATGDEPDMVDGIAQTARAHLKKYGKDSDD